MIKKAIFILIVLGVIGGLILFLMDWGTVESEISKTDFSNQSDTAKTEQSTILDLSFVETGTYAASNAKGDNLELLFNIDGLKKTTGRFDDVEVKLEVQPDRKWSKLEVYIASISIFTNNKMRDESLIGPDYFDAAQFPMISFVSDSILLADTAMVAYGKLDFLGEKNPLNIPFKVLGKTEKNNQNIYGFEGAFAFDRTQYGMTSENGIGDVASMSFYVDLTER